MTLLGNIPLKKEVVVQKTGELSKILKPFTLEFGEVSFSTTYFQSVFVRVKSSAALMDANLVAKKTYRMENNVFMPHISLIYGNHTMEEREKIVSEIEIPRGISFRADKVIITPSTENPAEWAHIAELQLK